MAELHPFFVHFPIAIILVAALFDVYGAFKKQIQHTTAAFTLLILAAISALFAAISGNQAESVIASQQVLSSSIGDTFATHTSIGNLAVWMIILVAVGRTFAVLEKKSWSTKGWIFPAISVGLSLLLLATGLLGGQLSREILQYFVNN